MFATLIVLALASSVCLANISGSNPGAGTCLCFTGSGVNVRDRACGTTIIGQVNAGRCFKAKGLKQPCSIGGTSYQFFSFDYNGRVGWAAGNFIRIGSASSCGPSSAQPAQFSSSNSEGYTCAIAHQGRRVHETLSATEHDCVDSNCRNTCRGGQCVAYVKCSCTRGGKYPPRTSCWRPGTKVVLSNGKCNRAIPVNTAIATFGSNQRYYAGHAAVFAGCKDDNTIQTYDQGCCTSIGYRTIYNSSHKYYRDFAVVTNPGVCPDPSSWPCRFQDAGATCCKVGYDHCQRRRTYY